MSGEMPANEIKHDSRAAIYMLENELEMKAVLLERLKKGEFFAALDPSATEPYNDKNFMYFAQDGFSLNPPFKRTDHHGTEKIHR